MNIKHYRGLRNIYHTPKISYLIFVLIRNPPCLEKLDHSIKEKEHQKPRINGVRMVNMAQL